MFNVLHLGLSFACNMHCKHCFVDKKNNHLKTDDFYKIIDNLYNKGLVVLYYTYGEPLLSKDFEKVSNYAKNKGLVQILMTNGYLLDDKKIELIKSNKISNVFISIDSLNEALHDNNRGLKGAYKKAIEAIRRCVKNNVNVGISTTVTEHNASSLQDIYNFAIAEKVKVVSFLRERSDGVIAPLSEQQLLDYRKFFVYCMQNTDKLNVNFHDPSLLPLIKECFNKGEIDEKTYDKFYNMNLCHYGTTLSISPDGLVRYCNLAGKPFGCLATEPLDKILEKGASIDENYICCPTISK